MKRVYVDLKHYTSDDKELISAYNFLVENKEHAKEKMFKKMQKQLMQQVRKAIDTNRVICMAITSDEKEIGIFTFDVEATNENFYDTHYDEKENKFYIEMEDELNG